MYIRKILNIIAGDSCVIQKTGARGECLTISLCPVLIQKIRKGNRDHTVCGYEGRMQIVCCPLAATAAPENKVQPQPIAPASASNERISIRSKKKNYYKTINKMIGKFLYTECNEYKEAVYESKSIPVIWGAPPVVRKVAKCSSVSVPLVIGGTDANQFEFPHMVCFPYFNIIYALFSRLKKRKS